MRRIASWLVPAVGFLALAALVFWRGWTDIHGARRVPGLDAGNAAVIGHAALAGLGMYVALRLRELPHAVAAAGGVVLLVPPMALGLGSWAPVFGLAWLPWALAAFELHRQKRDRRWLALVVLPLALAALDGGGFLARPASALGAYPGVIVLAAALCSRRWLLVAGGLAALFVPLVGVVLLGRLALVVAAADGLAALHRDRRLVWILLAGGALVATALAVVVVRDPAIGQKAVPLRDAAALGLASVLLSTWSLARATVARQLWPAALVLAVDVWMAQAPALERIARPAAPARASSATTAIHVKPPAS